MAASEERFWIVEADESGEVNPPELAEAMLEVAGILRRVGGAASMVARRRRLGDGPLFLTERIEFHWMPHAPLPQRRRQPEPVEPAAEPAEEELEDESVLETAAVSG